MNKLRTKQQQNKFRLLEIHTMGTTATNKLLNDVVKI